MQRLLQFTLDLFEAQAAPAPSPAPEKLKKLKKPQKTPNLDHLMQNQPEAGVLIAHGAIDNVVDALSEQVESLGALPLQTLQQALAPATFAHPQATRQALLGGITVAYAFKRGKRRTIGFSVGPDGLAVSAPKWVPLYDIDKAVQGKAGWIVKKLQETRLKHQRLESARIDWRDGCALLFLGKQIIVVLDPSHAFSGTGAALSTGQTITIGQSLPSVPQLTLHVGLMHNATPDQIKDAVQAWLMRQAKLIFTERLDHFAPTLKVQWQKLSLSSAGTRWGSASANGAIRLNWRLIHFKQSVIDYVVVHELSHLRVMDHSPRFWSTVESILPDYALERGQLKGQSVPRW